MIFLKIQMINNRKREAVRKYIIINQYFER